MRFNAHLLKQERRIDKEKKRKKVNNAKKKDKKIVH